MNITQSALYQTDDMNAIKSSMQTYFVPYQITLNPFKVLIGAAFSKEIKSSDHNDGYKTATFTSIKKYFEEFNLAKDTFEFTL